MLGTAVLLLTALTAEAAAQADFDATGQFFIGFKLDPLGKKKSKPEIGFRFGSSTVPMTKLEEADPVRRGLNLTFDKRDKAVVSFSGVELRFGANGQETGGFEKLFGSRAADAGRREAPGLSPTFVDYGSSEQSELSRFSTRLASPQAWVSAPLRQSDSSR